MADQINLIVDQGSTYKANFEVRYANNQLAVLDNYTGAGKIRKFFSSNTSTDFSVNVYSNGTVSVQLSANQTAAMDEGRYVYDVEITNIAGEVTRLVEGSLTITPEVTR